MKDLADILYAQWRLIWPLSPSDRIRYIEEVRRDYLFELQMEAVMREMELKGN